MEFMSELCRMKVDFSDWGPCKDYRAAGMTFPVYTKGSGPNVLLMHELPGLTSDTLELAENIIKQDYRVHLPVFFGQPARRQPLRNLITVCISREIYVLACNRTSPITNWLKSYISSQAVDHNEPVAVIGMCLTGNFALAMVAEPAVMGVVACQPSLPLMPGCRRLDKCLAIESASWQRVCERVREPGYGTGVMVMRYENDWISPVARFDRIREDLGPACKAITFPGDAHSTLVYDQLPEAVQALQSFLEDRLKSAKTQ